MKQKLWKYPLLITTGLLLAGCEFFDDDDDDDSPPPDAFVRVTHASPDAPSVDVFVDGALAIDDLPWQGSSGLLPVPEGDRAVRVVANTAGGEVEIYNETLTLMADQEYNVFAIGNLTPSPAPAALGDPLPDGLAVTIVARDDVDVAADMVRVQVLHGAQGVPAVDVHVTAPEAALDDSTVLDTLAFGQWTATVEVPAGTYQVRLTVDGDDTYTPVYDLPSVDLAGGSDVFITAIPNLSANSSDAPVDLLVQDGVTDEEGNDGVVVADPANGANLRIVHTIDQFVGVDIYVNDSELSEDPAVMNLEFPDVTPEDGYLSLPAGMYDFDVAATGTDTVAISVEDVDLMSGVSYSVLAIGDATMTEGETAPMLWLLMDDTRTVATDGKLRLAHAHPGAPAVDIMLRPYDAESMGDDMSNMDMSPSANDIMLEGVTYMMASDFLNLAPGKYVLWVVTSEGGAEAYPPTVITISANALHTALVVADADNETGVSKEPAGIPVGIIMLDDSLMPMAVDPKVRVLHASPDAPSVNVLVDGEVALAGVDYKQASGLLSLPAGDHTVQIDALNPDGTLLATVLPETTLPFDSNTVYNISAIGYAGGMMPAFGPSIVDVPFTIVPDGYTRVTVQHAAPNAGVVDVHVTAPDGNLSLDGDSSTRVAVLDFGEWTMTPLTVMAGDYRIRLTAPSDTLEVVYDSGPITLSSGYDVFVSAVENTMAMEGNSPVQLLVMDGMTDEDGNDAAMVLDKDAGADLRVAHAVANEAAATVDIWVNDSVALEDVPFKAATDFLGFEAEATDFYVTAPGATSTDDALISAEGVELMSGGMYDAIAIGGSNDKPLALWAVPTVRRTIFSEVYLRFYHAATAAPNVDIYLSADMMADEGDTLLVEDLAYGAWDSLWVAGGEGITGYVIVTPTGTFDTAIGPLAIDAMPGYNYSVIAIDSGETEPAFGVIDLDGIAAE